MKMTLPWAKKKSDTANSAKERLTLVIERRRMEGVAPKAFIEDLERAIHQVMSKHFDENCSGFEVKMSDVIEGGVELNVDIHGIQKQQAKSGA